MNEGNARCKNHILASVPVLRGTLPYDIVKDRIPRKRGLKPPPGRGTFDNDQPMIYCAATKEMAEHFLMFLQTVSRYHRLSAILSTMVPLYTQTSILHTRS